MKSTFVSTAAISQAMRYSLLRAQSELTKAQKEVSTGRHRRHRPGARLAHRPVGFLRARSRTAEGHRRHQRACLGAAVVDAGRARPRSRAAAQSFLSTLTTSVSGDASPSLTLTDAKGTLQSLTAILNSSYNGEHLFAGINTDVEPVNDFTDRRLPEQGGLRCRLPVVLRLHPERPGGGQHHRRPDGQFPDHGRRAAIPRRRLARQPGRTRPTRASPRASRSTKRCRRRSAPTTTGMRKLAMAAATVTDDVRFQCRRHRPQGAADTRGGPGRRSDERHRQSELQDRHRREPRQERQRPHQHAGRPVREATSCRLEGVDPYEASTRVSIAAYSRSKPPTR